MNGVRNLTMCEANNEEGQVRIVNIFGEQKVVRGRVRSLSLVNHKILLEEQ